MTGEGEGRWGDGAVGGGGLGGCGCWWVVILWLSHGNTMMVNRPRPCPVSWPINLYSYNRAAPDNNRQTGYVDFSSCPADHSMRDILLCIKYIGKKWICSGNYQCSCNLGLWSTTVSFLFSITLGYLINWSVHLIKFHLTGMSNLSGPPLQNESCDCKKGTSKKVICSVKSPIMSFFVASTGKKNIMQFKKKKKIDDTPPKWIPSL